MQYLAKAGYVLLLLLLFALMWLMPTLTERLFNSLNTDPFNDPRHD